MLAAVDDVEQRHGQDARVGSAEVAVQRQVGAVGGGLRDGERDAEDGVRAGARLVLGPVGRDEDLVDDALLAGVDAFDFGAELVDDRVHGLQDALAAVAALVAVAELIRLEGAGGRAGGDGCALDDAVVEQNLHLDGRVAARVQDLACAYCLDQCHGGFSLLVEDGTGASSVRHRV
ncbi:hypothetical protein QE428_002783 [Microbacterium sp. SORGH_AS 505]|nr:hypothetical protein [Microbacterium sp. SORGH_AS_0505]